MNWFNYWGVGIIVVIMIPNVIFAIKHKEGFVNSYKNRTIEILEQIGRFGTMFFIVFNIPYLWFGFWMANGLTIYLIVNSVLLILYCAIWMLSNKLNKIFKALALSIIPAIIFLFSGVMITSVMLMIAGVIFAIGHITLSYKNAKN